MSESSEKILHQILHKQEKIEELLILFIPDLKTKKGIATFFGVTDRTIGNWIQNGKFEEGIEYLTNEKGKPTFIPSGILNHHRNMGKIKSSKHNNKNDNSKKINHPAVQNILKGVKIG